MTYQHRIFSPRKHILLSKCWCNTLQIIFSKCPVIKYTNNNQHYIHYLCSVFCHPLSLSSALTLPSLISFQLSTWRDSGNTWNITVQQFIRPKLKCILLVCRNTADTLGLLASSPHLLCLGQQYSIVPFWLKSSILHLANENVHTAG